MAVKIRLKRLGKIRVPQYRIVVVDSRKKRDGRVLEEITSAAFLDNPASLGVSRKVGYRPTTVSRIKRREGELALNQGLVLTPDDLVRDAEPIRVTGAEAVRAFIGLDAA